jgi:transcriptional regulator with XRE-family HTH domain
VKLVVNLRVERLERGQSQAEIASAADVAQSTWSRAERGVPISPGEARKIAKYLDRKV